MTKIALVAAAILVSSITAGVAAYQPSDVELYQYTLKDRAMWNNARGDYAFAMKRASSSEDRAASQRTNERTQIWNIW